MKKRLLSTLLALCVVLALLPGTAWAEEPTSGTCGENLTWSLAGDTLTISGSGEMYNAAGSPWRMYLEEIKNVILPVGLTCIGSYMFSGCSNLTSISIPNTVTSIGTGAFSSSLATIFIPVSVTEIDWGAFIDCTGLTDVYYDGNENNWANISIGYRNELLTKAKIHYNSTGMGGSGEKPGPDVPGGSKDVSNIKINGKSIQSLFSKPSTEYDNDLSLFAANLSWAAEDKTGDRFLDYYCSLEWPSEDREIYQYGGDRACSIACAKLSEDENLLVITTRGSQTGSEFFEDFASLGHRNFFGYTTNDVVYDFENDIMDGLNRFLMDHEYLEEKDLKVLVTGHSLGGAAANLNAARFTMFEDSGAWWSDLTEQSDIYCYTFGAINSLSNNSTVKNGFENIHNVYNLLDSFGPYRWGNKLPSGLGRGYGKFGHMEMYSHNYENRGDDQYVLVVVNITNHLIEKYIDSLNKEYVSCNKPFIIHGGGVWCPVDLKIYLESADGPVLVGSITNNQIDEVEYPMVGLRVEGDKKYFYLPDDGNYTLKLEGSDSGTMTYFVQDMDAETGEPIDGTGIVYQQVQLTTGKQFYSDIKVEGDSVSGILTEKVPLYVLNENGDPEKEVLPDGEGTEIPITTPGSIYTITLDPHGGTVTPTSSTTNVDGKLTSLPTPTRSGYTFNGWFTAPSGGARVTTDTVFSSNTTIYAQWTYVNTTGSTTVPSSRPSSNSSSDTTYNITIPSVAGGAISVSPKSASKGSTVTITATPNVGYELVSVTTTDSNGKTITLTDKGNGKYTFTMPGGKVSINAVFQLIQTNELEVPWDNPFSDISEGEWYYEAVRFVQENGLMNGYGDNTFAPSANLSRAMLAQILYNKEGCPTATGSNAFADVVEGAWYTDAVTWAAANGIVSGYGNGLFGPSDNITREQLAVMLWRYAGEPTATSKELHFNDANEVSGYALDALRWAVENGIINGYGHGRLNPGGQATRAQVAQMLMNFLRK